MRKVQGMIVGALLATAVGWSAPAWADDLPVTPQKLALAEQLVEAQGQKQNLAAMTSVMSQQMNTALSSSGATAEDKQFVIQVMKDAVKQLADKVLPQTARVYAETFTDGELTDLLAFYNSPTGREYISKIPEVLHRQNAIMMPLLAPMQAELMTRILDHICQEQKCTPEQKRTLETLKQRALQAPPAVAKPTS